MHLWQAHQFIALLFLLLACLHVCMAQVSLQFEIGAGKIDCFYHPSKKDVSWEMEYQVIDGGDLDIGLAIYDPRGTTLFYDEKATDNLHRVEPLMDGDYRVCFDNSFSRMTPKVLFFEIYADAADDHIDEFRELAGDIEIPTEEQEQLDMTVKDIQVILGRVHVNLEKATKWQALLRAFEARDRNLLDNNMPRVQNFSMLQLTIMITAGLLQVFMIRSLFEDRSRMGKMLRGTGNAYRSIT